MDQELINVFKKVTYQPNKDFSFTIWQKIIKRKKRASKIKLGIFSLLGITSFVGFLPIFRMLLADLSKSGFYEYLSVAFSDNRAISYWKEIILSITESLPMTSLILSLTLSFVFILSLCFVARNIRIRSKLLIA
jgi:hypothetical protein